MLPSYYYTYWWDPLLDYPIARRSLLSACAPAADVIALRNIDWRIRRLELSNWTNYDVPTTLPTTTYRRRLLETVRRVRLATKYYPELLIDYPRFTKSLLDTEMKPGHNVYLEVRVQGEPAVKVKWYKNGLPLVETSNVYVTHYRPDSYVLTIRDALTSDRGLYSCVASNIVGETQTTAHVRVITEKRPCTTIDFYDALYDL